MWGDELDNEDEHATTAKYGGNHARTTDENDARRRVNNNRNDDGDDDDGDDDGSGSNYSDNDGDNRSRANKNRSETHESAVDADGIKKGQRRRRVCALSRATTRRERKLIYNYVCACVRVCACVCA